MPIKSPAPNTPRRGRPRVDVDEPSVTLSIRLAVSHYDQLAKTAHLQDQSLASLARDLLKLPAHLKRR